MMERALALTIDYVKQRTAFGKKIIEFQNTQFELADCKTEATIARSFIDQCIERLLKGELDTVTASMAKYWTTDTLAQVVDRCLQLFGGYGFMDEYPISRHLPRRPRHAHLCGHERDHEAADREELVSCTPASFRGARQREPGIQSQGTSKRPWIPGSLASRARRMPGSEGRA